MESMHDALLSQSPTVFSWGISWFGQGHYGFSNWWWVSPPWIYIIAHLQHPSDTNSCILLKKKCGYFFEPDFYQFHLLSFSSCTWRNSKLSLPIELCRATHDLQIFSVFPLFYSLQLMDLSLSIIPSMEDIP